MALPYSKKHSGSVLTIVENILSLILQIFLYSEAFECNTTSDWIRFSQSEVVLHSNLQILGKKKKHTWVGEYGPRYCDRSCPCLIILPRLSQCK